MVEPIGASSQPSTAASMLTTQFQLAVQVASTALEIQQTLPETLLSQAGLGALVDITA